MLQQSEVFRLKIRSTNFKICQICVKRNPGLLCFCIVIPQKKFTTTFNSSYFLSFVFDVEELGQLSRLTFHLVGLLGQSLKQVF